MGYEGHDILDGFHEINGQIETLHGLDPISNISLLIGSFILHAMDSYTNIQSSIPSTLLHLYILFTVSELPE